MYYKLYVYLMYLFEQMKTVFIGMNWQNDDKLTTYDN